MPLTLGMEQMLLEQSRFDGGVNMLAPGPTQMRDARNVIIRDGKPTTRPGIRQYLAADGGFIAGFYFNEDGAEFNDATHTGFWFPFSFARSPWGTVQGVGLVKLSIHTANKIIFASGGYVYVYEQGYVTPVDCTPAMSDSETVEFVQANDAVYLFKSGSGAPLYWDGGAGGFVVVPDAAVGDDIPHADNGLFHAGRMWCVMGDDIYASAVLDFTEWDYVTRCWSVDRGGGDGITAMYPFHEDTILVFKAKAVRALGGVNSIIPLAADPAEQTDLNAYLVCASVDNYTGSVAPRAIVTVGEDVLYLGYGGIYSLQRNQQNKYERRATPISAVIQPYIDRITWSAVGVACAVEHDNYVLFAVPIDGSARNNCLLVLDRIANGGAGAWCGVWRSTALNPLRFFHDDERLIFLGYDNKVRQMFTNDPWDSESPYSDTPAYDADVTYEPGDVVFDNTNGDRIYRALATTKGNAVTDATYWEQVSDVAALFDIEAMIESRQFSGEQGMPAIRFSAGEIIYEHQDPKLTLALVGQQEGEEQEIETDLTIDPTAYDVADRGPWDETNAGLDFALPYRKDYPLAVGADGLYVGTAGVYGGIWKRRNKRFQPMRTGDRSIGVQVTNARGRIRVSSIAFTGSPGPIGGSGIV